MIRIRNLLLRLHSQCFISNFNNKYKLHRKYVLWLITNIGYRTIELLFVIYLSVYRFLRLYPNPLNDDGKLVVSLTSFPARIGKVWIVIDSLMAKLCVLQEFACTCQTMNFQMAVQACHDDCLIMSGWDWKFTSDHTTLCHTINIFTPYRNILPVMS